MSKGQTLQDPFLNALRKDRIPVSIFLVNGIKLQGQIESFDQYVVLLKNTVSQMVYKHAISTVVPARNPRTSGSSTSASGMHSSSNLQAPSGFSGTPAAGAFDRGSAGFEGGGFTNKRTSFNRSGFTERGFNQERGFANERGFESNRSFDDRGLASGSAQPGSFESRGFEDSALEKRGFQPPTKPLDKSDESASKFEDDD